VCLYLRLPVTLIALASIVINNEMPRGTSFLKKLVNRFKTSSRAPPPQLDDGKYESEEIPDSLKGGIIKELSAQKKGIPEDLDILLEFVNLAKAGGNKFDPTQLPQIVLSP
jgi:hypothetical protein